MYIGFNVFSMNKGGAERVVANLANYFDNQGDKVILFLFSESEPMYKLNANIEIKHLTQKRENNASLPKKISYNIRLIRVLRKHLKDSKCEVIFCMASDNVYRAVFAGRGITKVIGTERTNPYRAFSKSRLFMNKCFYRLSDGYVFQTRGAKKCYGNKGSIIGNPVMIDVKSIEWDNRKKNAFCAVGRLADTKNYPHMIRIFEKLHCLDNSFTLDIYGTGEAEEKLRKMIEEMDGQEYIKLKGNVENVYDCLAEYQFFLICSIYEGLPNALMEAMLCGCVCISTDFDFGPSELIRNGINGFIIPENDTEALANLMKQILKDKVLLNRVSNNAVSTIKSGYDISHIGKKYRDYATEIINRNCKTAAEEFEEEV